MDTVRLAKELGDMSLILPPGITSLVELPYPMFNAVRNALGFIGFDELPSDERPSRDIWMEPKLLKEHFDRVDVARKAKYGGKADNIKDEPIDGPVTENALAKELLV